jgi:hypothetical protein
MVPRNTFAMRVGLARLAAEPAATQLDLATGSVAPGTPVDPIVHELLHHAATNSAVNVVMQHRLLSLLRPLLSSPHFSLAGHHGLIALAANLAALEAVLQPLAEGIALYGEFDCAMPDVEQFKRTGYGITDGITWRLFALQRGMETSVADFAAAARREKLSAGAVERRVRVLWQYSLFPRTGNDAYLLGYLAIKAIADRAVREADDITPAMLVEFLLYYIYQDWTLAHLLATPGPVEIDAMVGHVRTRMRALLQGDVGQRVAAFNADKLAREQRGMLPLGREELEHGPFAGLGVSRDEIVAAREAMNRFWHARVGPAAPVSADVGPKLTNVVTPSQTLLMRPLAVISREAASSYAERQRSIREREEPRLLDFVLEVPARKLPLGTALDVAVEFAVDNAGALHLRADADRPWRVSPTAYRGDASRRSGRARLLGVFMSTGFPWHLYCCLFDGWELLAHWGTGENEELSHITEVLTTELELEKSLLEAPLVKLATVIGRSAESRLSDQRMDSADAATVAVCDALRELLSACGWAPLFADPSGGNEGICSVLRPRRLVTPLAALGLCNSFCRARSEVEAHMARAGHDLNALVASCAQLEAATGLRLLATDAYQIYARV